MDDAAFAASRARSLGRAGRSRRAIAAHLAARGVAGDDARAALPDTQEAELAAALALAKQMLNGPGQVYVFSDFQKANWESAGELPAGVTFRMRPVTGLAAPINAGGSLPVQASGTTAVGDAAYSAASGQTSNTSTNAVLIGKFLQIGAANALAVIELESVA